MARRTSPKAAYATAQVAQTRLPSLAAVADLPADQQGLLVVLDGPPHLAQGRIRIAQVAQLFPSPRRSPISRLISKACS